MSAMRACQATNWPTYFLVFYAYFGFGTLLQVFPPLLDTIRGEFSVSRGAAALVMTVFMAPLVLLAVPAGLACDRLGTLRVGRLGFGLLLLGGAVTALADSFPVLLLGRAVSGAGGPLLVVTLLKVIAQTFTSEQRGLALGIFVAGLPAGTGIAFNVLAPIGFTRGWQLPTVAALVLIGTAAVVFELVVKCGAARLEAADLAVNPALALRSTELWRLVVTTALGYMAILGFTTWTPTTLVPYAGILPWVAALLASLLLVIDIPFAPLWGTVSDRVGRRKPFIVAGAVGCRRSGSHHTGSRGGDHGHGDRLCHVFPHSVGYCRRCGGPGVGRLGLRLVHHPPGVRDDARPAGGRVRTRPRLGCRGIPHRERSDARRAGGGTHAAEPLGTTDCGLDLGLEGGGVVGRKVGRARIVYSRGGGISSGGLSWKRCATP